MSKRQVQWVILCEDRQQEVLVRRLLQACGFTPRKLRVEVAPAGRGSAVTFVRRRYPLEVKSYRKRNPIYWGLIVVTDADMGTVSARMQELDSQLQAAGEEPRSADERIALLVPRRNVETWIHFLLGNSDVNETDDYKDSYRGKPERDHCQPAAERLLELVRSLDQIPEECPPSLTVAIDELKSALRQ